MKHFILIILLLLSACAPVQKPKEPVKIAVNVWPGYAHAFVAQEKEFFKEYGVDVELVLTKEYHEAHELFHEKKVDGIFNVYADTVFHNTDGTPSNIVYIVGHSITGDVIISKPEINSVSELNGKKIGIDEVNSFSHIFVLKVLENAGLSEGDVFFEVVPAQEVLDVLEQGRIDAGHTREPAKSRALAKGYKQIAHAGEVPGIITDTLTFYRQFIQDRPDDVQAVVNGMLKAQQFLQTNKEEALVIMADAENMTVEEMNAGIQGIHQLDKTENIAEMKKTLPSAGKAINEFYLIRGQVLAEYDLNKTIDSRFVEAAQ